MADNFKFSSLFLNNFPFLPQYQLSELQKDLLSGSMAGLMIVLTGHPLDTIKVRMQILQTEFKKTFKNIVKREGALALYKGVRSPLYSAPIMSSISFASYEAATRFQGLERGEKRTTAIAFCSGIWSGFVFGLAVTPIEVVKNRLQIEGIGSYSKSSKLSTMIKKILRYEGARGLYKGLGMTFLRDLPYFSIQFSLYEKSKEVLGESLGESSFTSFLAGAMSVLCAWTISYPQDTIKTKMQCSQRKLRIRECVGEIYRTSGIQGFCKGLSPCLMRAIVTGSMRFLVFDKCQELTRSNDNH